MSTTPVHQKCNDNNYDPVDLPKDEPTLTSRFEHIEVKPKPKHDEDRLKEFELDMIEHETEMPAGLGSIPEIELDPHEDETQMN